MSDDLLRFTVFFAVLIGMGLWEMISPRRQLIMSKLKRWRTNILLSVINSFTIKLLAPITAIVAANYALDNGWGLLTQLPLPLWLDMVIGFLLLDLAIYVQHVLSHKIPFIWQLHRLHHSDRDIDVSTAIRFHPLEILLSMLYKVVLVLLLGISPMVVLWFEIILNASAMFNHSNIKLAPKLDKLIRLFIITPDMHRVHHSTIGTETNANYGFALSLWDRLFKSYVAQPQMGHQQMTIGLQDEQHSATTNLVWGLSLPFKSKQ